MKTILDICRLILWGPVREALYWLSPGSIYFFEKVLSVIAYYVLAGRRKAILNELIKSFGGERSSKDLKKTVRKSFRVYIGSQLRMFYLDKLNSSNIDEHIAADGLERLDSELKKKKGVIVLNPHFGPFMLIMPALSYRGYKLNQLALQGEPPWGARKGIDKRVYEIKFRISEGNMPVNFINAAMGQRSLREAIKALNNNEILLFPSTGRGGAAWHTVKFMGRKALFDLFPFRMALKTGASLLPAFVICEDRGTRVIIERPIDVNGCPGAEGLLEQYIETLDSYTRRHPDHLLMYIYAANRRALLGGTRFFVD